MTQKISISGAREHNLKNVSIDIPRDKLVVITGLSGSGKSSLAFDTIYADGQRRYVESLSAYARQFLEMMQKPDVDQITGLSPAISIEQKTTSRNPRSTVGTVTEIYDYLRLLYARVGVPYSPATGLPIESQTVSEMVDKIMALPEAAKLYLLAPIVRGRKGEFKRDIALLKKDGFQRIRVNGEIIDMDEFPDLDKKKKHNLEVVVDRIRVREGLESRLADSLETALKLADGLASVENIDTGEVLTFSQKFACPVSGFSIDEIEPRIFSFNNPFGACPECDGLGTELNFDEDLIVPDVKASIIGGAIAPWASATAVYYRQTLESVVKHFKANPDAPWSKLPKPVQEAILYGTAEQIKFVYDDGVRHYSTTKNFEGVIPNMRRRYRETDSNWVRDEFSKYQIHTLCAKCTGFRLKPEALAVKINQSHISEVTAKSIIDALDWIDDAEKHFTDRQKKIAERILKEIRERLGFLRDVGLNYLTLSRSSGTLSGGESQRIRLASQIGSGLTGVLYVLDEPSIGLHQRDNDRLLVTLRKLRDQGNTVIVVEHDEDAIRSADFLIDMGLGAGIHGGEIVASGTPEKVFKHPKSLTAQYIRGAMRIEVPPVTRKGNGQSLKFFSCTANNLKQVDLKIPLGIFCAITGVSGSGKSSLVIETVWKALARQLMKAREHPGAYKKVTGIEHLDKVIDINQSPIGRTPRSNPATYTGAFSPIRDWFANLPEAKARGYKAGRFSFNVKGGRCEACQGEGLVKIEMHFLPDVHVTCDQCKGKRYGRETLEVKFKGKSISDVLEMTVEEGAQFFSAVPSIRDKLVTLEQVGLGYIQVGQSATTLSGGEAQRVKLAKELSRRATGRTLYILDEPTTGLHFEDVRKLLEVLHDLVDQGNSIIVIEHNLEVIKTADWVIDVGPEGGDGGGYIVAAGKPSDIAKVKESHTGQWLKKYLIDHKKPPKSS